MKDLNNVKFSILCRLGLLEWDAEYGEGCDTEDNFDDICEAFEYEPEDFTSYLVRDNYVYVLVGFDVSAKKEPALIRRLWDGKVFRCSLDDLGDWIFDWRYAGGFFSGEEWVYSNPELFME